MKHITALTLTTLLAATGLAQTAAAAAPAPVALDLTAGYDSEYIYRGLWFSNQNAWYNIGASKKLSDSTTLNALAYYTSSNDRRSSDQELDLGANLAYDAGLATLTAGYTYFFFFNGYAGNGLGQSFAHEVDLSAAKAVGLVLPQLVGKVDGFALRVPTINVSLVDLTFTAERATTKEEINALMTAAANGPLKGILDVNNEPLVSSDFNHTTVSSTFDATQTRVIKSEDGSVLVKVLAWYDNEWGYSCRMLDAARAWMNAK